MVVVWTRERVCLHHITVERFNSKLKCEYKTSKGVQDAQRATEKVKLLTKKKSRIYCWRKHDHTFLSFFRNQSFLF